MRFWDNFDSLFQTNDRLFQSGFFQTDGETIKEEDDKFTVSVDLPGVEEAAIEVTVDNHRLRVASERNGQKSSRAFRLGEGIDEEHVSAVYKHGVLTVALPKLAKAQPRRIELSS